MGIEAAISARIDGSSLASPCPTAATPPAPPNAFVEEDGVVDVQSLLRSSLDNIGVARVPNGGRDGEHVVVLSSPRKSASQRFREAHLAAHVDDDESFSDGSGASLAFA